MQRIFLRYFSSPLLFFIFLLLLVFQTTLFRYYPLPYLQPDLTILFIIWYSLKRPFWEGGILTLLSAYALELHSSSPQGMYSLLYMSLFLWIRILYRYIHLQKLQSLVFLSLACSVLWKLLSLWFLSIVDHADQQWKHTLIYLAPGAISTSLFSWWIFPFFEKFDRFTARTSPSTSSELEDDLSPERTSAPL